MEQREWESTNSEYCGHSCQGIMAMALKQWKNSKLSKLKKPTLKELYDALSHLKMDKHLLCQVQFLLLHFSCAYLYSNKYKVLEDSVRIHTS